MKTNYILKFTMESFKEIPKDIIERELKMLLKNSKFEVKQIEKE